MLLFLHSQTVASVMLEWAGCHYANSKRSSNTGPLTPPNKPKTKQSKKSCYTKERAERRKGKRRRKEAKKRVVILKKGKKKRKDKERGEGKRGEEKRREEKRRETSFSILMTWTVAIPPPPSPANFAAPELPLTPTFGRSGIRMPPPRFGMDESSAARLSASKVNNVKRKRVLSIQIPKQSESFAAIEKGLGSDGRREVLEEGLGFAVFCKRGKKKLQMEDRHAVMPAQSGVDKTAIFGVFDGHGGNKAAEFCSKNMGRFILNELEKTQSSEEIEHAVRSGYLKTDEEFLKEESTEGSCCVTALLHKGNLIVSNAGDCRAVLSKCGQAEALTSDHKLSRTDERERVEKLGAFVDFRKGTWRLQGSLAVSRGIGDGYIKQWVSPEPETQILKIQPGFEFLILASDGLWDKVGNQEAVDLARPFCVGGENNGSVLTACKELAELAVTRGSLDDTSVMIVLLGEFADN
ncbi:hypothetical protein LUZ60_003756 [Juncus effusus]|nr:hypothetical protein LUZ60_003756 [Juncus effusus]